MNPQVVGTADERDSFTFKTGGTAVGIGLVRCIRMHRSDRVFGGALRLEVWFGGSSDRIMIVGEFSEQDVS